MATLENIDTDLVKLMDNIMFKLLKEPKQKKIIYLGRNIDLHWLL